jgi:hypothetical protein
MVAQRINPQMSKIIARRTRSNAVKACAADWKLARAKTAGVLKSALYCVMVFHK